MQSLFASPAKEIVLESVQGRGLVRNKLHDPANVPRKERTQQNKNFVALGIDKYSI